MADLEYPDQIPCEVIGHASELPERLQTRRWNDLYTALDALAAGDWHELEFSDVETAQAAQPVILHHGKRGQFWTRRDGASIWVQRRELADPEG